MDVFCKNYYTLAEVAKHWNRDLHEIQSLIIREKLIPSYFLKGNARSILFTLEEDEDGPKFDVNPHYDGEYFNDRFVFLRCPIRISRTEYEFDFACDDPTAPLEEFPSATWYEFDEPITSGDDEIVLLKSQVEKFEQTYSSPIANHKEVSTTLYPWGEHNTRLLQSLSDVATALWSRYDPLDPSTAPTNEQVEDWLIARDVPKRIAEAMATILRADGLRMGRRKR